jgi:hypothetical protein
MSCTVPAAAVADESWPCTRGRRRCVRCSRGWGRASRPPPLARRGRRRRRPRDVRDALRRGSSSPALPRASRPRLPMSARPARSRLTRPGRGQGSRPSVTTPTRIPLTPAAEAAIPAPAGVQAGQLAGGGRGDRAFELAILILTYARATSRFRNIVDMVAWPQSSGDAGVKKRLTA